jgi:hypothetical protein
MLAAELSDSAPSAASSSSAVLRLAVLTLSSRHLAGDEVLSRARGGKSSLTARAAKSDAWPRPASGGRRGWRLELRAARRVVAEAGAAQAFLVLLVALLARLLVLGDQLDQPGSRADASS